MTGREARPLASRVPDAGITRRQAAVAVLAFVGEPVWGAAPRAVDRAGEAGSAGADETARIEAMTRTTGGGVVDLGGRSYRIAALRLPPSVRLRNAKLHRAAGADALVTIGGAVPVQTIDAPLLEDLQLFGFVRGVRTGTGLEVGEHAAFRCRNIGLIGFVTGYRHVVLQFGVFENVKAYDNDVGFYLANDARAGGNNSNDYRGLQAVQNKVGVIVDGTRFAPNHSNNFYNPQILGNTLCGMAFFGAGDDSPGLATLYGYANEANAASHEQAWTYAGLTIRRASLYCHRFHLTIVSGFCAEAVADPNILLEQHSVFEAIGFAGYGRTDGRCVHGDRTSACTISSSWDCTGSVNCVESFSGSLGPTSSGGLLAGPIATFDDPAIRNDLPAAQLRAGSVASFNGSRIGTVEAADGLTIRIGCAAADGSGVLVNGIPYRARGRLLVAFEIEADADCRISVRIYPNLGPTIFDLFAGRRTRVVYWTGAIETIGDHTLVIYKLGPGTPLLIVRHVHVLSGDPADPSFRATCDRVLAGARNPRGTATRT